MRPRFQCLVTVFFASAFCLAALTVTPLPAAENISEANRAAFELKVKELLKSEFFVVVKGRPKPNLHRVNDAAGVQEIIKTGGDVFKGMYSDFLESWRIADEVFSGLHPYISDEAALGARQDVRTFLLSQVIMGERIKKVKRFYDLKKTMDCSRFQLMLMPVKLRLLQKAARDFNVLSGAKALQFPDAYRKAADVYLKKISAKMNESAENGFEYDADASMRLFIRFLAQMEFQWLQDMHPTGEEKPALPADVEIPTATLRLQDGVVIVYGEEAGLNSLMAEIRRYAGFPDTVGEVETWLHNNPIPGIHRAESFYSYDTSKTSFFKDSVRSAEFSSAFPLIEGLEKHQAQRLLDAFGFEAEILDDCREESAKGALERLRNQSSGKYSRFVVLCGTEENNILFSAWP